ncbi:MAG TPA: hypothetical protein VK786_01540, partial [bacterium]|nr:hypothetical protein [bacterium]
GQFPTWGSYGYGLAKQALNFNLYLRLFSRSLNGWPWGLAFAPILAGLVLRRPDAFDRYLWCLLAALALGYSLYFSADIIHGPRYWFEMCGFALLLQVRGLGSWLAWLRRAGPHAGLPVLAGVAFLMGMGVFVYGTQRIGILMDYNHVEGRLRRAVEALPQVPSLVFFANEDPTRYVEAFSLQDPWLQAPYVFAGDQGSEEADKALVNYFPGRRVLYWDGTVLSPRRWKDCVLPL